MEWCGGKKARLLVVAWGTENPAAAFEAFKNYVADYELVSVEMAPVRQELSKKRAVFLQQLSLATGVFFSGGTQTHIMDAAFENDLVESIRARYRAGLVVGGTSAGAAILSQTMLTGNDNLNSIGLNEAGTAEGLGLLNGAVVDQHFVQRQRQNRMFSVLLKSPERIGLGIDEGTALLVQNGRDIEVVGSGLVSVFQRLEQSLNYQFSLKRSGESFSLLAHSGTVRKPEGRGEACEVSLGNY